MRTTGYLDGFGYLGLPLPSRAWRLGLVGCSTACYPVDYGSVKPSGHRAGILRCRPQAIPRTIMPNPSYGYRFHAATSFQVIRSACMTVSWYLAGLAGRLPVLHTGGSRLKSVAAPDADMESSRLGELVGGGRSVSGGKMGSKKGLRLAGFVRGGQ